MEKEIIDGNIDYIQEKNRQLQMFKEMYLKESEINYIAFCLGYDLINEMLSKSKIRECDTNYDFCEYLAKMFMKTDYYKNKLKSTYDNLKEWLDDNKEIIKSEHLFFCRMDNKIIMDIGKRNDTPVALVVNFLKNGEKEYIIAFNYEVTNKKIEWGYGYYYNDNLRKAKEDFEKVKAGGNLVDTFKENNKNKNKEKER